MSFYIFVALFIIIPIAEISVLIDVGRSIGLGATLLIVIFTAILGAHLVRQQGKSNWQTMQSELHSGRVPAMKMAEGVALLVAGIVLMTPGFITDAFGFALLTPPIRQGLIKRLMKRGIVKTRGGFDSHSTSSDPRSVKQSANVIEGEYRDHD